MKSLNILRSRTAEMHNLRAYLEAPNLEIIEAGCGRRWHPELANPTARITGIDTDGAALSLRTDLVKAVLGDVCTAELPQASADVVYCSYVLEHVRGVETALSNFLRWLKPGGVLIIRIPDRNSVYGFVTRLTPFWFHVAFKRWIMGSVNAGKPGAGPYPTCYEPIVSREGIHDFCARHRCTIVEEYGVATHFRNRARLLIAAISFLGWALSFGQLAWRHNNLHYVIRRHDSALPSRAAPTSPTETAERASAAPKSPA